MITLSLAQEQIVKQQVTTGQYTTPEEVIDVALQLLNFLDAETLVWFKETQQKIQAGLEELDRGEGVDGTIVMEKLLQRFYNALEGQQK